MAGQPRNYPVSQPLGPYLRPDIGNFPGNPGLEFLAPIIADASLTRPSILQENIGSLIAAYRTGRPMPIYQDVSSLTAQLPIENVFPTGPGNLQPISSVYLNILSSYPLGGKA